MRNHVITKVGRTIIHYIYPLDTKPGFDPPAPIKIMHTQDDPNDRIKSCLEALKKELEGEA